MSQGVIKRKRNRNDIFSKTMRKTIFIITILCCINIYAQETVTFGKRGETEMKMDIYVGRQEVKQDECIIYVFGGGFKSGSRRDSVTTDYCRKMQNLGFTTIAIDYRLGMKGFCSSDKIKFINEMEKSIHWAVEDLSMAVAYIVEYGRKWDIDPQKIITTGSSAGAITVLQTDYYHARGSEYAKEIPADFRFAGVMAFAGAIFSREGLVDYTLHAPAPTMMWHGTKDNVVKYSKIQFGSLGFFGSSELVKRFEKAGYPYYLRRVVGAGHDVCEFGNDFTEEQLWFIEKYVRQRRQWQIDETYNDRNWRSSGRFSGKTSDLYNKKYHTK